MLVTLGGRLHFWGVVRHISSPRSDVFGSCPQVGHQGHSSVEDAMTAMELYKLVEVQWEQQEASNAKAHPEDRGPDSSTDVEQYMEDRYWPDDLAQSTSSETRQAQDGKE